MYVVKHEILPEKVLNSSYTQCQRDAKYAGVLLHSDIPDTPKYSQFPW